MHTLTLQDVIKGFFIQAEFDLGLQTRVSTWRTALIRIDIGKNVAWEDKVAKVFLKMKCLQRKDILII